MVKSVKIIAFFLSLYFSSSAQEVLLNIPVTGKTIASFIPKGYDTIEVARGDLNKDGIADVVMALKNNGEDSFEMDEEPKRLLLILFQQKAGYKLAGKSENALMCRACGGMYGDPYNGIIINKGILSVTHYGGSNWRWFDIQKFRYQQNGFFLIGSTSDSHWIGSDCNGKGIGDSGRKFQDMNWLTGEEEVIERDENCRLIKKTKRKLTRSPLIKLESFEHE
ncbi:hypothetical protein ESA94_00300 [Lacibacter luteus]|uniref:VCBS repeat-containing protein n=1 Tax=Lacibacter luteus TaxID=2508719 RepID=A0A4Q1CLC7_9BACT|nr:hypothetical protein [Lacibacter luteus]RXK61495.1 hypothetical protein ESA94_00300 [Lacibacter luteus]